MKIAPIILGAVYGQSGDYSDYQAPEVSEDRWDSWGADNSFNVGYGSGGKAFDQDAKTVNAVTCWQSNHMGNLAHYTTYNDSQGNQHHGHDQAQDQGHLSNDDSDAQVGSYYIDQTTAALDFHSVLAFDNRYSGCIYEVSNWNYDQNSYKYQWQVRYGHNGSAIDGSGIDQSTGGDNVRANWWHYFNAHVFAGGSNAVHKIVMANPQYEGLGYLNFVVTFAKSDTFAGDGYNAGSGGREGKNFNTQPADILTDSYSAGTAFEIFRGGATAEEWYSTYSGSDWASSKPALSSFPHNDLGKDFRFNVRVLHKGGDGDIENGTRDSYYFYKINKIGINFPYTVRCPKEVKNVQAVDSSGDTYRCMDSAGHNGHRGWYNNQANPAAASQTDQEKYNMPFYQETLSGYSGTAVPCVAGYSDGEKYQCGNSYFVQGLMNTYDEAAQKEYGTHQEFWFQFFYHFEGNQGVNKVNYAGTDHTPYNFPNILFNAFEVSSVSFNCNSSNLYNGNSC